MRVAIFRKGHFNAAHRLFNPAWDDEKNREVFGICSNSNFHGHNYDLEVKIMGELNQETGILMDLKQLKEIIETKVEVRFDHKNLNLDCPEFIDKIPTAENICIEIYKIMRKEIAPELDVQIRLYETARNYVEYPV
ncbi:MAG: 6-carboxytetrahydropterin synthase [Saprospiraceae bacterium]|nr:6-carboxytetrahydropterin synthase [Candidatus Vicinibacter affinis]MBK8643295.1 6-carboxytetrahydropterin synthase [Candidatus Vicinibacter affinis]MBK9960996.1 6-carboxytetrahydropterin synthase [Candidatus Vicinibacter affinis]HQX44957.1 6-carboxytetrahydropterin synthase [Saprospiraceae bacterium]HRG32538.1 6-carboxytetrahydropterin synthase [Saprospiraceae bacterium]